MTESFPWWHHLKPHRLLKYVPRHTAEELDDLEKRVRAAGRIRDPIRTVLGHESGEQEIVDGLGRWEVAKRTGIEPRFDNLGREDGMDVAAVILDYGTRRNLSAEQRVRMYLDLNERSEHWKRECEQATKRARAARSDAARAQPREASGHFCAKPAGAVSSETRPVYRERDRIARATHTSPATVSRVLARSGESAQPPMWKKLHGLLSAATKSLEAASEFATDLDACGIAANDVQELRDRAHVLAAKIEAKFAEHP